MVYISVFFLNLFFCVADVRTFEILLRQYDVRKEHFIADLGISGNGEEDRAENEKRGLNQQTDEGKQEIEKAKDEIEKDFPKKQKRKLEHLNSESTIVCRPVPETKGHTGYLTFARKCV